MAKKILITGGVRSGKSAYAVKLALEFPEPRVFVATAEPLDESIKERIAKHKQERGDAFSTIEEPIHLEQVVKGLDNPNVVLIDCFTFWLNNLFYRFENNRVGIKEKMLNFILAVQKSDLNIILVTNETGLGVMPNNSLARDYVDELGWLNQQAAALCDGVIFMVAGLPQKIKGSKKNELLDSPVTKY